jgi:prepilin-type N-terminal cleavage/methylation domain-containing protein
MCRVSEKKIVGAGFTLVELLTVMAIIALLIGLMVPALSHVRTSAKVVQQKAQLKSIETALEAFNGMYGDYPPSNETTPDAVPPVEPYTVNTRVTVGAQKLAEAVLGVDLRGFDPRSSFDRRTIELSKEPYAVLGLPAGDPATQTDVDSSLNRRKGPYITINENVNSYEIADLFRDSTGNYSNSVYGGGNPGLNDSGTAAKQFGNVICDSFKVKNITYKSWDFSTTPPTKIDVTVKVGTPILYYKADPSKRQLGAPTGQVESDTTVENSIYNWHDNQRLVVDLKRMAAPTKDHQWVIDDTVGTGTFKGAKPFYDYIRNPKIGTQRWPYNPDTFILISAGPDGIYGNSDDITNFGSTEAK